MARFKRILLKLSGESLMGEKQYGIDEKRLGEYAQQIKEIHEMAHKLGLTVNVWTVDKDDQIRWCIQNGVDFITTNQPALVKNIIKDICK